MAGIVGSSINPVSGLTICTILFAAGLITGEALMGIGIAIPIVLTARADVPALPATLHYGGWLGLVMLALLAVLMYRMASRQQLAE